MHNIKELVPWILLTRSFKNGRERSFGSAPSTAKLSLEELNSSLWLWPTCRGDRRRWAAFNIDVVHFMMELLRKEILLKERKINKIQAAGEKRFPVTLSHLLQCRAALSTHNQVTLFHPLSQSASNLEDTRSFSQTTE